jgi:hypothetical protein
MYSNDTARSYPPGGAVVLIRYFFHLLFAIATVLHLRPTRPYVHGPSPPRQPGDAHPLVHLLSGARRLAAVRDNGGANMAQRAWLGFGTIGFARASSDSKTREYFGRARHCATCQ